jgi:Domain of unknown function(DUF2779)
MANLSKSKILAFRQCPKRLWLEVHKPELRVDSAATQAKFRTGHQVGEIARKLYDPEGRGVTINAKRDGYTAAFAQSEELLAKADRPVFEAGLRTEGALAFADVMLPEGSGSSASWRMVEVKSSASVKDYQKEDIAVQSHIATATGVRLKSVSLACIDSRWVYPGGGDYGGLLVETDLTQESLSRSKEAASWIAGAQEVAARTSEPDIRTGDHCFDPYECGFCGYCRSQERQPRFPLDWLPRFSSKRRAELAEEGIDDMSRVPDDTLNDKQLLVKRHTLAGTTYFDAEGAEADLAHHGLPALFMDFETVNPAVPIWEGTRPFQAIPFEFSLHRLAANGRLTHEGFLDLSGNDPMPAFVKALLATCGDKGPIFVYNATFERVRIEELAKRFPKESVSLLALLARIVDMLSIARERFYHPSMGGSWSIKDVLPAVAPDLNYCGLDGVNDGGMAMEAFQEAMLPDTPPDRKETIRQQLEAYCRLDTFAMVRLWHFFSGRPGTPPMEATS